MTTTGVVVGIDEMSSASALAWAAHDAGLRGCELLVVSTYEPPEPDDYTESRSDEVDDSFHDVARDHARRAVATAGETEPGLAVRA